MRATHFIAPSLAGASLAALVAPRPLRKLARVALAPYAGCVGATAARAALGHGTRAEGALMAAVLPAMHLAWGFGALAGTLRFGPPVAAVRRVLGLSVAPPPTDPASVVAPSLHERAR
jgi:hypothetical protein